MPHLGSADRITEFEGIRTSLEIVFCFVLSL